MVRAGGTAAWDEGPDNNTELVLDPEWAEDHGQEPEGAEDEHTSVLQACAE